MEHIDFNEPHTVLMNLSVEQSGSSSYSLDQDQQPTEQQQPLQQPGNDPQGPQFGVSFQPPPPAEGPRIAATGTVIETVEELHTEATCVSINVMSHRIKPEQGLFKRTVQHAMEGETGLRLSKEEKERRKQATKATTLYMLSCCC